MVPLALATFSNCRIQVRAGLHTDLYSFSIDDEAGSFPYGSMVFDWHGNLYGTTALNGGPTASDAVWELTP